MGGEHVNACNILATNRVSKLVGCVGVHMCARLVFNNRSGDQTDGGQAYQDDARRLHVRMNTLQEGYQVGECSWRDP